MIKIPENARIVSEQDLDDICAEVKIDMASEIVSLMSDETRHQFIRDILNSNHDVKGALKDFASDFLGEFDTTEEYIKHVLMNAISVIVY